MFSRTSSTSLTGAGPLTGLEWASDRRGPKKCPREMGCRAAPLRATRPPCPCRRTPPPRPGRGTAGLQDAKRQSAEAGWLSGPLRGPGARRHRFRRHPTLRTTSSLALGSSRGFRYLLPQQLHRGRWGKPGRRAPNANAVWGAAQSQGLPVSGRREAGAGRIRETPLLLSEPRYHHQRRAALAACGRFLLVTGEQAVPGFRAWFCPPPGPAPATAHRRKPGASLRLCTAAPGCAAHTWTPGNFPTVQLRWNHLYAFLVAEQGTFNFLFWFPSLPASTVCLTHDWRIVNSPFLRIHAEMKQQRPLFVPHVPRRTVSVHSTHTLESPCA